MEVYAWYKHSTPYHTTGLFFIYRPNSFPCSFVHSLKKTNATTLTIHTIYFISNIITILWDFPLFICVFSVCVSCSQFIILFDLLLCAHEHKYNQMVYFFLRKIGAKLEIIVHSLFVCVVC